MSNSSHVYQEVGKYPNWFLTHSCQKTWKNALLRIYPAGKVDLEINLLILKKIFRKPQDLIMYTKGSVTKLTINGGAPMSAKVWPPSSSEGSATSAWQWRWKQWLMLSVGLPVRLNMLPSSYPMSSLQKVGWEEPTLAFIMCVIDNVQHPSLKTPADILCWTCQCKVSR